MDRLIQKLSVFIFGLFVFVNSVDPTGTIFHVKEVLFILLMSFSFLYKSKMIPSDILLILFTCLLFPLIGIFFAVIQNNFVDPEFAVGHYKSFLFILIFFYLIRIRFPFILKSLFFSGTFIAVVTVVIFLIGLYNEELYSSIYIYTIENNNILMTRREFLGIAVSGVYFKAGPLMFFSYYYSLYLVNNNKAKFILCILHFFALSVAGSRTPSLICLFITAIYLFDKMANHKKIRSFFMFFAGMAITVLVYMLLSEKDEFSMAIKNGDFDSYIDNIFSGITPFIGDGLGSTFYAAGRQAYVPVTEQTYMDILRIYGLILGPILIFCVIYPAYVFFKSKYRRNFEYKRFVLVYVLYMILAGTNPLLISSTGMLIWAIGLTLVFHINRNNLSKLV